MSRKPLTVSPVDRAMGEVEQRLAQIEREARQITGQITPPPPRPGSALKNWLKDVFTPPSRRPLPRPVQRDLFDPVVNNPMPHLETQLATGQANADLFVHAERKRLGEYLSTGSVKTYKPLKHVQRRQREQFYLWLGLGIVAVLILWLVMH